MKKVYGIIMSLLFVIVSITGYGLPAQEMKNYKVLCETFETKVVNRETTKFNVDEFCMNVIGGMIIIPYLMNECQWSGKINPEFIKERYENDEMENKIAALSEKVHNSKYKNCEDKKRMFKEIADFYKTCTSGANPDNPLDHGAVLTRENVGQLNALYSLREDFGYDEDVDMSWSVDWGEDNRIVLGYDIYEIEIPFIENEGKNSVELQLEDMKLYMHRNGVYRVPVMGYEKMKTPEYLMYITGKVLELEMYVSQAEYSE